VGKSYRIFVVLGLFVPGLFWLALAPAGARADEQADKNACMTDAQVYCGQFIPDRVRVAHCLMANHRRISPACRQALRHFK
jgi:hypothetical protein